MARENTIKPRLGRIGNRGAGSHKRLAARVRKISATLSRPRGRKGFTGKISGRGNAAAAASAFRQHPLNTFRARRVVVKTHIARANKGIGKAAFKAHLKYIQRDGVERDGSGGELYDKDQSKIDDRNFLTRSENDRHQFRIIVSPEDADRLPDLKENTRKLMAQMERDLGTKLDWVGVDHHNTGHPHTHIVIRGKDDRDKDLIIAREYITSGMRRMASDLVTRQLGPRQDLEIARAQVSEVSKERFTSIDHRLADKLVENKIEIAKTDGIHQRFQRTLEIRRLRELEKLRLAEPDGKLAWRMTEGWQDSLKSMGRRHDIIRSISQAMGADKTRQNIRIFDSSVVDQKPVLGRIKAIEPDDELRDTRFIVVEGLDGHQWHISLGAYEPGNFPGVGAIVEVHLNEAKARKADKTIAEIAAAYNGIYSDDNHATHDPTSTAAFREAHKRRLEALRRAGFAVRNTDGSWAIGPDYIQQAEHYEISRTGTARLDVKSWLPIDELIRHEGLTWLDKRDAGLVGVGAFANEITKAADERRAFLIESGRLKPDEHALPIGKQHLLEARERSNAAKAEADTSKRAYVFVEQGETFKGDYEKPINLAQGRFAVVGNAKEFTLVPWRPSIERHRGNPLVTKGSGTGISWTLEKTKGLGR